MPASCSAEASPSVPSAYSAATWCGFSPYLRSATLVNVAAPNSGKQVSPSGGASTEAIQRATATSYAAVCANASLANR